MKNIAAKMTIAFVVSVMLVFGTCSCSNVEVKRGSIATSDGVILAESVEDSFGAAMRNYPEGSLACQVVGSCNGDEGAEGATGIESTYAAHLEAASNVVLTLDSKKQALAEAALEGLTGSVVIMDPYTGAVLALASSPAYDLNNPDDESLGLANLATTSHIPGSSFKTITLSAALESGKMDLESRLNAPASLSVEGGSVRNMDTIQYGIVTLREAYEKSINTVFAQLSFRVGIPEIVHMAEEFGFEANLVRDIECDASKIENVEGMSPLARAWCGVGQALLASDGSVEVGPTTTALHMAAITSCFVNGGTLYQPFLVSRVENELGEIEQMEPSVFNEGFLSDSTIDSVMEAMRGVVRNGTASSAFVPGVDVGGKTGTSETSRNVDDGWFCGFALSGEGDYVVTVLIEGEQSSCAANVFSSVVENLRALESKE